MGRDEGGCDGVAIVGSAIWRSGALSRARSTCGLDESIADVDVDVAVDRGTGPAEDERGTWLSRGFLGHTTLRAPSAGGFGIALPEVASMGAS